LCLGGEYYREQEVDLGFLKQSSDINEESNGNIAGRPRKRPDAGRGRRYPKYFKFQGMESALYSV
jgi:hypothetical protein